MYKEYQTGHYIFHYQAGSLAENDIEQIARLQETCFLYICDVLQVDFTETIHYWLCDTPEEVGRIYGDNEPCCGFANEPDTVYAVYNEKIKCIGPHEDAHLISYKVNIPDSCFLREGLAMFFDRSWWGISNREWSVYFRQKHMEKSITELFIDSVFYDEECSISYPIAGAFTEYLICRYGLEKYIGFYKCSDGDFESCAMRIFGKSLKEMDNDFWQYIELDLPDQILMKSMEEVRTSNIQLFGE